MSRQFLSLSISCVSLVLIVLSTSCGSPSQQSSAASLQDDLESVRSLTLSCKGPKTPVDQLAAELSKKCRAQNAQLKARGLPACQQDECSDHVTLLPAQKGLTGTTLIYDSRGNPVGFKVLISDDIKLSTREKSALICYAPVLKAEELLNSMAARCK